MISLGALGTICHIHVETGSNKGYWSSNAIAATGAEETAVSSRVPEFICGSRKIGSLSGLGYVVVSFPIRVVLLKTLPITELPNPFDPARTHYGTCSHLLQPRKLLRNNPPP